MLPPTAIAELDADLELTFITARVSHDDQPILSVAEGHSTHIGELADEVQLFLQFLESRILVAQEHNGVKHFLIRTVARERVLDDACDGLGTQHISLLIRDKGVADTHIGLLAEFLLDLDVNFMVEGELYVILEIFAIVGVCFLQLLLRVGTEVACSQQ
jgi:hypothetical protein